MNNISLIHSEKNINNYYTDIIISIIPIILWGIYIFGLRALSIVLISLFTNILVTYLVNTIFKLDYSLYFIVESLLLALMMPASSPLWLVSLLVVISNVVKICLTLFRFKLCSPMLLTYTIMYFATNKHFVAYPSLHDKMNPLVVNPIFSKEPPIISNLFRGQIPSQNIFDILLGNRSGSIGEISCILLIIALVFLLIKKVYSWHITTSIVATIAILSYLFPTCDSIHAWEFTIISLFASSTLFIGIYLANEYEYTPITSREKLVFGIAVGALTYIFRVLFKTDGLIFSLLICEMFYRLLIIVVPKIKSNKKKEAK